MGLFSGSVAVIFAVAFGIAIGVLLATWIRNHVGDALTRAYEDPGVRNSMGSAWAYEQVRAKLIQGCTGKEILAFLDAETERIQQGMEQAFEEGRIDL